MHFRRRAEIRFCIPITMQIGSRHTCERSCARFWFFHAPHHKIPFCFDRTIHSPNLSSPDIIDFFESDRCDVFKGNAIKWYKVCCARWTDQINQHKHTALYFLSFRDWYFCKITVAILVPTVADLVGYILLRLRLLYLYIFYVTLYWS